MRRRRSLFPTILTTAIALMLGAPLVAQAAVPTPLSTSGSRIVDAEGNTVVLQGVNWFGFETANHAPHGLWARDYRSMLAQIRGQGFNTIRLPFSLEMIGASTTSGIDYSGGRNAALAGKTPIRVMDEIIAEAARNDLMVILDNHSTTDDSFMHPLWYGLGGYTEADWVATWRLLATRYADAPNVVGADLKNEPHGEATWGTGAANDWRRAAERAGAAVQAIAPHWLIVVEGIEGPVVGGQQLDRHWWGGNLEGVRANPIRLPVANRLVYSPHEYGPEVFAQPWFSGPNLSAVLTDRWNKGFGYIHSAGIAPILVGEFGAKQVHPATVEGKWIIQFTDYMAERGISWTFWAWNPNSGDTGGVLRDDWTTIHDDKMALLTSLMRRGSAAAGNRPASPNTGGGERPASDSPTGSSIKPRIRITNRIISLRLSGDAAGRSVRATRRGVTRRGSCEQRGDRTLCRIRVPIGRWTVAVREADGATWKRTVRVRRVPPIGTARWISSNASGSLAARFTSTRGTRYRISARRAATAGSASIVTGTCRSVQRRATCRVALPTGSTWLVTVQPRRGNTFGRPLTHRVTP
jgi:endoglucanase